MLNEPCHPNTNEIPEPQNTKYTYLLFNPGDLLASLAALCGLDNPEVGVPDSRFAGLGEVPL